MSRNFPVPADFRLSDGVVSLRRLRQTDEPALVRGLAEPEVARWIDQVPQPYTSADARRFLRESERWWREGTFTAFAVVDAATDELLGGIGVAWQEHDVAEAGYWAAAWARGRGVTTRALVLASRWALVQGAERVQLRIEPENVASRRVADKAGFSCDGVLRSVDRAQRQQRRRDFAVYSLLPGDLA